MRKIGLEIYELNDEGNDAEQAFDFVVIFLPTEMLLRVSTFITSAPQAKKVYKRRKEVSCARLIVGTSLSLD